MEEAGQGLGSEKSRPHERTSMQAQSGVEWRARVGWGGLVMDVPCD